MHQLQLLTGLCIAGWIGFVLMATLCWHCNEDWYKRSLEINDRWSRAFGDMNDRWRDYCKSRGLDP